MPTHDYPYKNLVFEGGGVKGVAYEGVFAHLAPVTTICNYPASICSRFARQRSIDQDTIDSRVPKPNRRSRDRFPVPRQPLKESSAKAAAKRI